MLDWGLYSGSVSNSIMSLRLLWAVYLIYPVFISKREAV